MAEFEGDAWQETQPAAPLAQRPEQGATAVQYQRPQAVIRPAQPSDQSAMSRVRTSTQIDQIAMALCLAQSEFLPVVKTRTATIEARANYSYSYATLADVSQAIMPALAKHCIIPMQIPSGPSLVTRLLHSSGQWIESDLKIVAQDGRGGVQALGSALTYIRRYALTAMLGIAPSDEEDDDGASAVGKRTRQPGED